MRDITCPICSREFQHWHYKTKYCSRKCANQSGYHKGRKRVLTKEYQLKKVYGLSLEQFHKMIDDQQGLCALCGIHMNTPYVDHCHKTKRVRKLLCMQCNTALGMVKENIATLTNMIAYIQADIKAEQGQRS